ncbi:hypothetical protein B0H10DRAFT_1958533 [Mycena sp. CBHHK59/15]|nr:hypothetical protein B0H10DRAFT_1958533 [Mycena sp. CBHHK59/15]
MLESPQFQNLDTKFPRKTWFEMIVRKFTKYRNQVYLKSPHVQSASSSLSNAKKNNPLLKFSSMVTGRQLFSQENHDEISSAAKQRALDTGNNNPGLLYQNILKERWDGLSGAEQSDWNDRADAEAGDVKLITLPWLNPPSRNQEEFPMYISSALLNLCEGKILGDAEMVLFYAFCESGTGDLVAGTVHGHSGHNQLNFGGSREELQLSYGKPWSDFAEDVIPHRGLSQFVYLGVPWSTGVDGLCTTCTHMLVSVRLPAVYVPYSDHGLPSATLIYVLLHSATFGYFA